MGCILAGLGVHRLGFGLTPALRDATGDALWALMMFAWLGVPFARHDLRMRAGLAVLVCWAVEFSQLYHTPALDAARQTMVGRLVLGVGFDARDLAAYAIGVLIGVIVEITWRRRRRLA